MFELFERELRRVFSRICYDVRINITRMLYNLFLAFGLMFVLFVPLNIATVLFFVLALFYYFSGDSAMPSLMTGLVLLTVNIILISLTGYMLRKSRN